MAPTMQRTDLDPDAVVAAIEHPTRKRDSETLVRLMTEVTGEPPAMWGQIIGWGQYAYRYDSGHSGEFCRIGFAPGKQRLSLYGLRTGPGSDALLEKLGKHRTGVGCVYVNKLADVDLDVLRELIAVGWRAHDR